MTDEKAAYILHELKSISYYEKQIDELDRLMKEISQRIVDIQTPSCPNGGDGVKAENHVNKSSIVNSLLSDEQGFYEERTHYNNSLVRANAYYTKLKLVCDTNEISFVNDFVKGESYQHLSYKHGYENVYRTMIGMIKRIMQ